MQPPAEADVCLTEKILATWVLKIGSVLSLIDTTRGLSGVQFEIFKYLQNNHNGEQKYDTGVIFYA